MKKSLIVSLMMAMMVSLSGVAFAGEVSTPTIQDFEVKVAGGGMVPTEMNGGVVSELSYPYPPQQSNIYFNVWVLSSAKPEALNLNSSYMVYNKASRQEALDEMKVKFEKIKTAVAPYGNLRLNYMDAYADYYYFDKDMNGAGNQTFQGNMDFTLELKDFSRFNDAKSALSENASNVWVDAVVSQEKLIEVESMVVDNLKRLVALKKSVYEAVLGRKIETVVSLNIYSYPDGSKYDPATGMVAVNVYADMSYAL